jgi:hypothetical protein
VAEVADVGGVQRDAVLVAASHGVLVAHGAARMHNGRDARLARLLHRVVPREGEERVRRHHRALDLHDASMHATPSHPAAVSDARLVM